jgi:hypothetical protein
MKMGLAGQMQNMTESFLHAHDLRGNELKEIFEETNGDRIDTRKMMRDLHTERLENTDTLQKMLGRFADTLTKEVDQAVQGLRAARRDMSGELHEQLEKFAETLVQESRDTSKRFRATHKAMSGRQREDLTKFVQSLEKQAGDMLRLFHKDQQKMGRELREFLSSFAGQNHKGVTHFLRGCNTHRKHTAEAQREFLAKCVKESAKETAQMRKRFHVEQNKRVEAVREQTETFLKSVHQTVRHVKKATEKLMDRFHDDHTKARHAWQQMAASMDKKHQKGPEQAAAVSGARRRGEKENALVKSLKETPEGMTLAELSYAVEMPSAATSKVLKHILKRKNAAICKKGLLYLPS